MANAKFLPLMTETCNPYNLVHPIQWVQLHDTSTIISCCIQKKATTPDDDADFAGHVAFTAPTLGQKYRDASVVTDWSNHLSQMEANLVVVRCPHRASTESEAAGQTGAKLNHLVLTAWRVWINWHLFNILSSLIFETIISLNLCVNNFLRWQMPPTSASVVRILFPATPTLLVFNFGKWFLRGNHPDGIWLSMEFVRACQSFIRFVHLSSWPSIYIPMMHLSSKYCEKLPSNVLKEKVSHQVHCRRRTKCLLFYIRDV